MRNSECEEQELDKRLMAIHHLNVRLVIEYRRSRDLFTGLLRPRVQPELYHDGTGQGLDTRV